MWINQADFALSRQTAIIQYNNQNYTLREASEIFGIPFSSIKNRYYKHSKDYTPEEIIFGKKALIQYVLKLQKWFQLTDAKIRKWDLRKFVILQQIG